LFPACGHCRKRTLAAQERCPDTHAVCHAYSCHYSKLDPHPDSNSNAYSDTFANDDTEPGYHAYADTNPVADVFALETAPKQNPPAFRGRVLVIVS
jgi:hypothetical protein